MIQEVKMYQAVCDGCGRKSKILDTANDAMFYALSDDGWYGLDGKLYCPDCVEYDEETDRYKPKKKEQ